MVTHNKKISEQKIKVLVLSSGNDFGRCPLASRLPASLWPVAGHTSLDNLLLSLTEQGIKKVFICPGQTKAQLAESSRIEKHPEVKYVDEPLPVGTGGCIREAAEKNDDSMFILIPSSLAYPPDIDVLIKEHIEGKSDLTVFLEPEQKENNHNSRRACGIYVCNPSVLEFIPADGYCDIKEGLIPKLLGAGKSIHAADLSHQVGNFRDCHEYLHVVLNNIESIAKQNNFHSKIESDSSTLWTGENVQISPLAKLAGQVVLMDGVNISEGAVIIGPCILGKNVTVGKNSVIINSILWDNAKINNNCFIDHCILDYYSNVRSYTNSATQCIVSKSPKSGKSKRWSYLTQIREKLSMRFPVITGENIHKVLRYLFPVLVLIAYLWSFWPQLKELWKVWMRSDEYSSGLLVPFLAVYILWSRRQSILQIPQKFSIFGLVIFIFAQALRVFGLFFLFSSAENISVLLSIAGLILFLFGWKVFVKVSTVILFLFLMLPWPHRVQAAVSLPLQSFSTSSAVFCLQVLGFSIIREGNLIHIGGSTVAVAEACNGLRMITAFFVISGLVALLVNRTWWEKLIVLISSLPVAFLCNTLRLTVTTILFTVIEGPYWEKTFHDFGGYAMMPLALVFMVGELWLIDRLTIPPEERKEIVIVKQKR